MCYCPISHIPLSECSLSHISPRFLISPPTLPIVPLIYHISLLFPSLLIPQLSPPLHILHLSRTHITVLSHLNLSLLSLISLQYHISLLLSLSYFSSLSIISSNSYHTIYPRSVLADLSSHSHLSSLFTLLLYHPLRGIFSHTSSFSYHNSFSHTSPLPLISNI